MNLCSSMWTALAVLLVATAPAAAEIELHPIFSDNMVLQRAMPVKIWGRAAPGENITVQFAGQTRECQADEHGIWSVLLEPMETSASAESLLVRGTADTVEIRNVLVGDVWLCGGQSNMEFALEKIYHGDVEIASARHPQIRLMTVPFRSTPDPQSSFQPLNEFNAWNNQHEQKGTWQVCSPESVSKFAAIGYIFGRRLHLATGVPIGLVDNAVGGTTVESWTSRQSLASIADASGLLAAWDERIAGWDAEQDLAQRVQRWEQERERRRDRGQNAVPRPDDLRPGPAFDRNNPGSSYNAMLAPLAGFRISGCIFHQGYNNALGDSRPSLYAKTFQAMIADWRRAFEDESLPFGVIELSAGAEPQTLDNFELRMIDAGPFIREAQFKAFLELENIGWAAAYDQQVNWYHPQMKVQLAERIARWALATRYGLPIGWEPARLVQSQAVGNQMVLTFDREVTVRDGRPIEGLAVAGDDQRFYPAQANFVVARKDNRGRDVLDRHRMEVYSPFVSDPQAVRYAWARCPLGNLTNLAHMERILPVPSFRTDNWDWPDASFGADQGEARRRQNESRNSARRHIQDRLKRQAEAVLAAGEQTTSGQR